MRNVYSIILMGFFLILSACASHGLDNVSHDETADLYLSTLDDKHFMWCKLDVEQCRIDFENWKMTSRGRAIIREYEKERMARAGNPHHVPDVFRTHFVDDSQSIERNVNFLQKDIEESSRIFGPELPSNY